MSVLDSVALIFQTYLHFRNVYRTLKENEAVLREVFDEIFLYEKIIEIYDQQIKAGSYPAEAFVAPIKKFAAGVAGFRSLVNEYSNSKGLISRAFNFCRTWCCTDQNSRRIKQYTQVLQCCRKFENHSIPIFRMNQDSF